MRFTRWCVMVGVLLLTVSGSSLALVSQDTAEYHILSLELMGPEETGPLAHFFIEPETGAWGVAGDWTYWEPEGGWYLRRDAEGIYRTWLLTGQEEKITNLPEDTVVLRAAVSPDGQWVAFAANIPPQNLTVYAVRSDGSEQRLLMHVGYTVRIWAFGWSEDGRSVEFKVQPNNLKVANVSVRLDRSAVTADNWYYISPDSRWMAWKTPNQYLYVMNLDTGETRQLPDMVAEAPLWSPDGQWLLYIVGSDASKNIYRQHPDGSETERLTQQSANYTGMWLDPEEKWVYIEESGRNLYRTSVDQLDSDPQLLAELPGDLWAGCWSPESVPGGPWLYFIATNGHSDDIYRLNLESSEIENLTNHPAHYDRLFWAPDGIPGGPWLYLMSNRDGEGASGYAIFRMKPDGTELKRLTESNLDPGSWDTAPKTIIQWSIDNRWIEFGGLPNCRMRPDGSDLVCLSVYFYETLSSPDGQWMVFASTNDELETSSIYGLREDGEGGLIDLIQRSDKARYRNLMWAPENMSGGPWLYFESDLSGDWELYRLQPDDRKLENLTRDPGQDTFFDPFSYNSTWPVWSPDDLADGPWLYFLSDRAGGLNLYRMQADGSQVEKLTPTPAERLHVEWSPDYRWLVFWPNDPIDITDGFRMRPDGSDLQQTIWHFKSDETGWWTVRVETPLDDDRWILEQEFVDCANWTVRLRAADSSEVRTTINIGEYIPHGEPCFVLYNILHIGSQHLDGNYLPGETVIWLPMNVD